MFIEYITYFHEDIYIKLIKGETVDVIKKFRTVNFLVSWHAINSDSFF